MSKVLVVDDNSDILTLLRITFEGAGHEVVGTSNPLEALPLTKQESPDAVVLDVMMPGMSGWDVLREIRRQPETEGLPVVLLTALSDVGDRVRGLRGGADDYQVKPFEPEEILARVEGIIARRGSAAAPAAAPRTAPEPSLEAAIDDLEKRIAARQGLDDLRLGRYEVREILGRGAMGTVLRGWDPKLKRPVALKTIRFTLERIDGTDRRRQVSRLLDEAITNARINHPNIVTVYDVADEGRAAFIAMELVDGTSLEFRLGDCGRLPYQQAIPLAAAVSRALAAAHQNGVVHRDIKPANVLLGADGSIKVSDFGVSEFLSQATETNAVFGTPGYLSPESLTGEATTPSSDLFSLGVTVYECLSGVNPFVERNWRRTLHNTLVKEPHPLAEFVSDIPPAAASMVARLLEKEPAARPEGADAVADFFEGLASSEELRWAPEAPSARRPRSRVSTTRSRLLTCDTVGKTMDLSAATA